MRILNGFDEFIPVLDVVTLLLYLRTQNIGKRPLLQEVAGNNPHCLTVLGVQPQRFQSLNSVFFSFLLSLDVFNEPGHIRAAEVSLLKEFLNEVWVFKDKGKDGLNVVLWDVFGLVMTVVVVLRLVNFFYYLQLIPIIFFSLSFSLKRNLSLGGRQSLDFLFQRHEQGLIWQKLVDKVEFLHIEGVIAPVGSCRDRLGGNLGQKTIAENILQVGLRVFFGEIEDPAIVELVSGGFNKVFLIEIVFLVLF